MNQVLTEQDKAFIVKAKQEGYSSRFIAGIINVGKSTVNDYYNKYLETAFIPTPNILLFDLETAPDLSANFQRWNVNISPKSVIQEGHWILSAAWKWLGESNVHSKVVTPEDALKCRDITVVAELYEAFERSDVVIAHNGDKFDLPLFRTRLLLNGFDNHRTVKSIDTLKIAKSLRFPSNKLESLATYLCINQHKNDMNIQDWIDCLNGNQDALLKMQEYNKQDIRVLEQVYLKLRGFDPKSNLNRFYNDSVERCSSCGHDGLTSTGNTVKLGVSEYEEVLCNSCGHRNRRRKNLNSKEKRSNILI